MKRKKNRLHKFHKYYPCSAQVYGIVPWLYFTSSFESIDIIWSVIPCEQQGFALFVSVQS